MGAPLADDKMFITGSSTELVLAAQRALGKLAGQSQEFPKNLGADFGPGKQAESWSESCSSQTLCCHQAADEEGQELEGSTV